MNVFDRHAKKLQRDRTAMNKDYQLFSYLKDEVNVFFFNICWMKQYYKQ